MIDKLNITKLFIFPVLNIFDIFEIIVDREFYHLESIDVLKHTTNEFQTIFEFSHFNLKILRFNDYFQVFKTKTPKNYHESRVIEAGIKKNYKELKMSSFRLKRWFSLKKIYTKYLTEFLNFKYPVFTSIILSLSLLYNII